MYYLLSTTDWYWENSSKHTRWLWFSTLTQYVWFRTWHGPAYTRCASRSLALLQNSSPLQTHAALCVKVRCHRLSLCLSVPCAFLNLQKVFIALKHKQDCECSAVLHTDCVIEGQNRRVANGSSWTDSADDCVTCTCNVSLLMQCFNWWWEHFHIDVQYKKIQWNKY